MLRIFQSVLGGDNPWYINCLWKLCYIVISAIARITTLLASLNIHLTNATAEIFTSASSSLRSLVVPPHSLRPFGSNTRSPSHSLQLRLPGHRSYLTAPATILVHPFAAHPVFAMLCCLLPGLPPPGRYHSVQQRSSVCQVNATACGSGHRQAGTSDIICKSRCSGFSDPQKKYHGGI